ncbi:MAG: zinc ribbon domain-containing protein [Dehalococcoidia bacterium]|nr:zinc ribbon domain-containing protein [Dehalococcoidia bacterium]MDZ4246489.1 zinc ribbon domain-containing protein [Dehalococcoidia bacterium]
MPIYEYICSEGHVFETFQKFSEGKEEKCEVCGAPAQRRPSVFNQPKKAGIHVFDRKHGFKDILHDPAISQRERDDSISDLTAGMQQSQSQYM